MADELPLTITRATPIDQLPAMLRVPEVAAWADVSSGVVYAAIHDGRLKGVAFGRIIRVPKTALEGWLSTNGNGNGHPSRVK